MDKDEAIHEVEEIKRVIDDTHKRSDHRKSWFVLAIALAVLVCVFAPVPAPLIGIGFIVGGVIARLRSNDSLGKATAIGVVVIGIVLVLIGLFVIFSLMGWLTTTSTTIHTATITQPPP
jgi:ABC-type microcin C transport system permease subunit YejB